jgi:hypothetical protein
VRWPAKPRQVVLRRAGRAFQNFTVTVVDVEARNLAGLLGINTALSGCVPGLSALVAPRATPATTGTGAPRLAEPSLSWTVPVGFAGTTCAVRITIPPSPRGKGTWTTLSAVVVAVAPGAGVGVGVDDRLGVGVGSALTT